MRSLRARRGHALRAGTGSSRGFAALLAVLAVLLHALATLPAAPAAVPGDPLAADLAVHCAPTGGTTPTQAPAHSGAGCPFCLCLHVAPPAMAPVAIASLPLPPAFHAATPQAADVTALAGRLGKSPFSQRAPPSIV